MQSVSGELTVALVLSVKKFSVAARDGKKWVPHSGLTIVRFYVSEFEISITEKNTVI